MKKAGWQVKNPENERTPHDLYTRQYKNKPWQRIQIKKMPATREGRSAGKPRQPNTGSLRDTIFLRHDKAGHTRSYNIKDIDGFIFVNGVVPNLSDFLYIPTKDMPKKRNSKTLIKRESRLTMNQCKKYKLDI